MSPRDGEKIGGGFFVFRRGKRTGRVACGALPFEHANMMAAIRECDRLAALHPGEKFVVVGQCYDARKRPETEECEANEAGAA